MTNSLIDELLPCPFCGGKARIDGMLINSGHNDPFYVAQVKCMECGATLEDVSRPSGYDGKVAALDASIIAAWNHRATMGAGTCKAIISDNLTESEGMGDAWADCSECGHLLYVLTDPNSEPPNYCPNCGRKVVDG